MEEVWKDIKGYEGLYQVSNLGRVKALRKVIFAGRNRLPKVRKEKILKQHIDIGGYLYVALSKDDKPKHYKVHRLVISIFIPNPNNLPCVNHKDECKTNNRVDNLEWCDHRYNLNYGLRSFKCKKMVAMVDPITNETIRVFDGIADAERGLNVARSHISQVCKGERKTAYGYKWRFEYGDKRNGSLSL